MSNNLRRRSVCFVTQELPFFYANGGGGTSTLGFAETLVSAGFDVHILYVTETGSDVAATKLKVDLFAAIGITIHLLGDTPIFPNWNGGYAQRSYAVYRWLKAFTSFVAVHFNDFDGLAFYSVSAKRCGAAFAATQLNVVAHGSFRWSSQITDVFFSSERFDVDHLERRSMEYADCLMVPSEYMREWMVTSGIRIPVKTILQRIILPSSDGFVALPEYRAAPIREIVFFGRHEVRKGFAVFVESVRKLAREHPEMRFRFFGKEGSIHGVESRAFALSRLIDFQDRISFSTPASSEELREYLQQPDRLAVIPSIDENFPSTVHECVKWGVNFIASNVGGIPEILDGESRGERLFEPNARSMTEKVREAVRHPFRKAARLGFDPKEARSAFLKWHEDLSADPSGTRDASVGKPNDPLVSLCLVHFDRPALLRLAIDSLRRQTYKNFELILIDDGSPSEAAQAYVREVARTTETFPIKLVQTGDIGLGPARNAGVVAASGEFLIFMDDDNIAEPDMIERMTRAIVFSEADAVVCFASNFSGLAGVSEFRRKPPEYYPIGDAIGSGLFGNTYGDAHGIWRTDRFGAMGGFSETRYPSEDWELYARAAIDGARIMVLPEQVYWYRQHSGSLSTAGQSRWRLFTQISDLYSRSELPDVRFLLQALQYHALDHLRRPAAWQPAPAVQDAVERSIATSAGFSTPTNAPQREGVEHQDGKGLAMVEALTGQEAAIFSADRAADLRYEIAGWQDVSVTMPMPLALSMTRLRAFVHNDSVSTVALRFAFLASPLRSSDLVRRDRQGELEIWRDFPPGYSMIEFTTDNMISRHDPNPDMVQDVLFGGDPTVDGTASIRMSLVGIRGGHVFQIMPGPSNA